MLALTLLKATALAWAAATSTLPGVFSTSPCKKKAKLEDCLHSESQCFTCTMLHLTAFQGGSSFPFRSVQLERRADDSWEHIRNWDLRNVIVHGNSSEQDLVQTHCLGRRLTLQVQSLQTSRQSKSGDVANCCQLQTASEDHHKTYYVCACGHVHQCLHAHILFLWHRQ